MEICLFHTDGDYLSALEEACLNLNLPTMRLRLFTEESLWKAVIQRPDFLGVAAGPRQALEGAELLAKNPLLLLTSVQDSSGTIALESVSILDGLDALIRACTRVLERCGRSENRDGIYFVFSTRGRLQQQAAFERLNACLKAYRPSDCLLDGTSLGNLLKDSADTVTHWLWEAQISGFQRGGRFRLFDPVQDRDAVGSSELEGCLVRAALGFTGGLWIWTGMEWPGFASKLISEAKVILWLCDHPGDRALAEAWTVQLKKRQDGLECVLIADRDGGVQGSRAMESPFDASFDSLEAFLARESTGW